MSHVPSQVQVQAQVSIKYPQVAMLNPEFCHLTLRTAAHVVTTVGDADRNMCHNGQNADVDRGPNKSMGCWSLFKVSCESVA